MAQTQNSHDIKHLEGSCGHFDLDIDFKETYYSKWIIAKLDKWKMTVTVSM